MERDVTRQEQWLNCYLWSWYKWISPMAYNSDRWTARLSLRPRQWLGQGTSFLRCIDNSVKKSTPPITTQYRPDHNPAKNGIKFAENFLKTCRRILWNGIHTPKLMHFQRIVAASKRMFGLGQLLGGFIHMFRANSSEGSNVTNGKTAVGNMHKLRVLREFTHRDAWTPIGDHRIYNVRKNLLLYAKQQKHSKMLVGSFPLPQHPLHRCNLGLWSTGGKSLNRPTPP